ncbi:uncharacterized protein DFL_003519 [Arthrobotrys flagrans]|uniref:cyclin-dependent kinase n=1 Tax=Arthrobotrys flagrans TaxID=97331 RepID=A0A437A227_ARTFL|nr:hypothetical protein DFL_003519 [Arthrobotrys flagrans]
MVVSISARFQATQRLSAKIEHSNINISPADALVLAKAIEKDFAKLATSEDHYNSLVAAFEPEGPRNDAPQDLPAAKGNSAPNPPQLEAAEEELTRISFGRYRNCKEHSIGGSSTIFKSRDPVTKELVALKVNSTWVQPHDAYRESRLLKRLGGDETHILTLLETETLRGEFILVLPYYPLTLADVMEKGKSSHLPRIFKQVAKALSFVHANGVIHRDIKPGNILLKSEEGPTYLCDFGTAWAVNDHHPDETADNKVIEIGTTCYRAPETLFGYREYGTEVDIWAFGCVIAEAENGAPLFEPGELGTDLRLILSIFQSLGTPTLNTWPEANRFPDFSKMVFNEFPPQPWQTLLPTASPEARDLIKNMVTYSQKKRLSADEILKHPYLT